MDIQDLSIHGHRLGVYVAGSGPVLLLVHGMAGSSATWRHVAPALAEHFTVVAPDLIGHGASRKPRRGEYSLAAHANVLRDLLHFLGHERVTLVGQSLGGGVAMQLAYQFPERCERMVLVGSGGLGQEVNLLLRALTLPGVEYLFPLVCAPIWRAAGNRLTSWLGRIGLRRTPAAEEIWRSYASLADADARSAFFRTLHAVVDLRGQAVTATDRLYLASQVPTLLVWGADDPLIPVSHAVAAHEAMPGSRLVIMEKVGHYPHCEAPEEFVRAVVDFMATTEPAHVSEARWRELLHAPPPLHAAWERPAARASRRRESAALHAAPKAS